MGKLEKDLIDAALQWLGLKSVMAWRNNTGAVKATYKGKDRYVRFGKPGASDIFGVLPNGRFLAAEAKATGRATLDQELFIERVSAQNGLAFVFHDLDEFIEIVEPEV